MCAREAKNSLSPHLAHLACGSPLLSGVGTPNRTRRDPGRAAVRSVAPVLLGRETPQGRGERQPAWWNPPWGRYCVASVGATTSHLKGPLGVICVICVILGGDSSPNSRVFLKGRYEPLRPRTDGPAVTANTRSLCQGRPPALVLFGVPVAPVTGPLGPA